MKDKTVILITSNIQFQTFWVKIALFRQRIALVSLSSEEQACVNLSGINMHIAHIVL